MVPNKKMTNETTKLTPKEMWDAGAIEHKVTPNWSCNNPSSVAYKHNCTVTLNEENVDMDNNIFSLNEPLSIGAYVADREDKTTGKLPVGGVEVTLVKPDGKRVGIYTDSDDGDAEFFPEQRGKWAFIVKDIGVYAEFKVVEDIKKAEN